MHRLAGIVLASLWLAGPVVVAQKTVAQKPAAPARPAEDYSGMYSFLKEGEFVQLNMEDDGTLTGFVSRYGDGQSDRGVFLDQFFKDAKLEGTNLSFTTKTVHGVWYEFTGKVERGEGKNVGDEAYYVLKGSLTQNTAGADNKLSAVKRDVVLKAFPRDLDAGADKR
jgi:hypothetical protein